MTMPPAVLDWSDPRHWGAGRAQPCIYCEGWTPLVDKAGRPAHKVCAERLINQQRARKREQS